MYVPAPTQIEQLMTEQHKIHEGLASRAEQQLRGRGFHTSAQVLVGDPREAIIDIAKAKGVDLIVLRSHGRSGSTKLIKGSVASHAISHAPCNVLVVRPQSKPQ